MKKLHLIIVVLLALCLLCSCSNPLEKAPVMPTSPAESATTPTEFATTPSVETDSTATVTTPPVENDVNFLSNTTEAVYTHQVERYYTAISNQWDEGAYFDHEMSALAAYYYDGNALENIGFTFIDLDGDNNGELVIGAIQNVKQDPLVFEIWTLINGEPVMLAQSSSRNRYYMQYAKEDEIWSVAYEAENGAANHAAYYMYLSEGKFEMIQGILFDAVANESAPWFMAYDLDWDTTNDMPIDEETANAVMAAQRNTYVPVEYIPFSMFK